MRVIVSILFGLVCVLSFSVANAADFKARLSPGKKLEKHFGSTFFLLSHTPTKSNVQQRYPSAVVAFDKDVRFAGNDVLAGTYEITLEPIEANDIQVVISSGKEEVLRFAKRPKQNDLVREPVIELIVREPPSSQKGRRRRQHSRRQRPRNPSAELRFSWDSQSVLISLKMTGVSWRSTPPPEIPPELNDPWSIVESSLMGFVLQNIDKHVEHFSDNFESDWDDGGSQEAHMQMIGRMLYEGGFEDTALKLDKLEWKKEDGRIVFRGIIVQAPIGISPLIYTVEKREKGWKIVHLDGPKQD